MKAYTAVIFNADYAGVYINDSDYHEWRQSLGHGSILREYDTRAECWDFVNRGMVWAAKNRKLFLTPKQGALL